MSTVPEKQRIDTDDWVDKYWSTYTKGDIAVDGIFFDDAVNQWTSSASTYMTSIAEHAHALGLTVTFNPGTIAEKQFFDIADKIVMIEDAYSTYSSGKGDNLKDVSGQGGKSSVILYNFSGSLAQQTSTVNSIVSSGVSEIYITTEAYTSKSSMWTQFVAAVHEAAVN